MGSGSGSASERVDAVLDLCGHGELGSVCPVESPAGHQAIEIIPALLITSWSEGKCPNSTGGHGVVVLLVSLDILSEFDPAMFIVVDVEAGDNGAGTERLGDSQTMGESIEPEDGEKYHLDYHSRRIVVNGTCVIGASCSFLVVRMARSMSGTCSSSPQIFSSERRSVPTAPRVCIQICHRQGCW
jgi:hypothetical protein